MIADGAYLETRAVIGVSATVDRPFPDEALERAGEFAVTCRCAQEAREILFDPHI